MGVFSELHMVVLLGRWCYFMGQSSHT